MIDHVFDTAESKNEISTKNRGFNSLRSKITYINEIKKTYKNFLFIMIHLLNNDFPFEAILKNDKKIIIQNRYDLLFLSRNNIWEKCDIKNDRLSLKYNNEQIIYFEDWRQNGDIIEIFCNDIYKSKYIKDSIVLDIGANIADSSIYFSLNKAKKIIALEPSPRNYYAAVKNIEINEIKNIEILLAGCAGERKIVKIDPDISNLGSFVESKNGQEIEMFTLNEITKKYKITEGVLKLDCEGYEHEILVSSENSTLSNFSYIFGELHYKTITPVNEIKQKLEKAGFDVSFSGFKSKSEIPRYFKAKK